MAIHATTSLETDSIELEHFVHRAVEHDGITQFSIGCSRDLVDATDDQACDFIVSLCVTDNPECALSLEQLLRETFSKHPKFRNGKSIESRMRRNVPRYVYLALWKSRSHK